MLVIPTGLILRSVFICYRRYYYRGKADEHSIPPPALAAIASPAPAPTGQRPTAGLSPSEAAAELRRLGLVVQETLPEIA